MRLSAAARYFDKVVCADAYNAAVTFMAQLDLFDDSKRDGGTVARRVLSMAQDVDVPARRAVTVHDETFILGGLHNDSFMGEVIRKKYVAHLADGLATVKTVDQAIRAQSGSSAYAARLWIKDQKEIEISSKLNGFFALYFSPTEAVPVGSVVTLAGRSHLVRQSFKSAAGFLLCEADELPAAAAVTLTTYTTKDDTYNEVTDTYGTTAASGVPALWHRFQADFDYFQQSAEKLEEGDITIHVSKTSVGAAGVNDTFVASGIIWRVVSVREPFTNVWTLHARRA